MRHGLLCALACLGLLACGDDEGEDGAPGDDVVDRVEELVGPVMAAIDHPSGTLNAESAPSLVSNMLQAGSTSSAAAFVPGAPPAPAPQTVDDPSSCFDYSGTGGTLDYACMSGGEITGTANFQAAQQSGGSYLLIDFQDVCQDSFCFEGQIAMVIQGDVAGGNYSITGAGELLMTWEGLPPGHVTYGYRQEFAGDSWTIDYAGFDDIGGSYTLDAQVFGDTGTVTITDSQGSHTCEWTDGGEHGSCSGEAGSFSW